MTFGVVGAVIVGAAVPAAQNVTLHRNGNDGTYYEVTTSGAAASSVQGRYNAFAINTTGTDSESMAIGLNTSTATAGFLVAGAGLALAGATVLGLTAPG